MEHSALDDHLAVPCGISLCRITEDGIHAAILHLLDHSRLWAVRPQHSGANIFFKFRSHKTPFSIAHAHTLALAVAVMT